jgi:hypothetical protein
MTLVILLNVILLGFTFFSGMESFGGKVWRERKFGGKVWRERKFGGKGSLAGKFWRESFGGKVWRESLGGHIWGQYFCGNSLT